MDEDNIFAAEPDIDSLADKFMSDWKGDEAKEEDEEDPAVEQDDETEDTEVEAEVEEDDDDEDDGEASEDDAGDDAGNVADAVSDDAEVTVKVDGKDLKLKVGDLKRLAGQEASLTQKSQAVAEQMRTVEAQGLYLAKVLEGRFNTAKARAEKYANVDLFKAQRELDAEDFDALRAAKTAAETEFAAISRESQEFLRNARATRQTILRERAKVALKEITKAIPEWSDDLYSKVRSYAVSQGMDQTDVNEIVTPAAIIMMNKAMQFDALKAKTAAVEKKVKKAPAKVVKKSASPADATASKLKAARAKAMSTGDIDAVTDLFFAAQKQ